MRFIALTMCLLVGTLMKAQGVQSAVLTIGEAVDGRLEAHFQLGELSLRSVGDGESVVEVRGMVCRAPRVGLPALPELSRLVELPAGGTLTLVGWQGRDTEELSLGQGNRLLPWAGADVKDAPAPQVEPDKEAYAATVPMAYAPMVQLEDLGLMADRHIYRLTVRPALYNPAAAQLLVSAEIGIELDYTSVPSPASTPLPERMLIVSRPQFQEDLQPFVVWKRQEGYIVDEIYAPTSAYDSVRALVRARWIDSSARWGHCCQTPNWMLIVGDTSQIGTYTSYSRPAGLDSHSTDLYYAEHTGDYLPDAALGRWPVADTAQLGAVVRKTVAYEQGRGLDTGALRRVLLVAGAESRSPAPVTTNGQVDYLSRELKTTHPWMDTLVYRNPASDSLRADILADAGRGTALLNYTAHCSDLGWTHPSVTFAAIDSLDEPQPTFYVNNCCQSNNFDNECFGTQLLCKVQGGAVGVVGATNSTLWNEDYYWAVGPKYPFSLMPQYDSLRPGAFDCWLGRTGGVTTAGGLLLAGNMAVSAFGSPYDRFYWEIYCLLGDPSLRPYVGMPDTAWVAICAAAGGVAEGSSTLCVEATPGSRVSVLQNGLLLGVAEADSAGHAQLQLITPLDSLPVVLTASGAGLIPAVDTVAVVRADTCCAVAFRHLVVTDTLVSCTVANIGSATLTGMTVILSQDSLSHVGATIATVPVTIDSLQPNQEVAVSLPVAIIRHGWEPLWEVSLQAMAQSAGDDMVGSIDLRHGYRIAYPDLNIDILNADGTPATTVHPEWQLLITATPTITADSLRTDTTWLAGDPAHLQIDADIYLGDWSRHVRYYVPAGEAVDGFEHGLGCYPWQLGGTQPWQLDSSEVHSGRYSLRSGTIDYRQTSDLILELTLPHADSLSFWSRPSSEPQSDRLLFSIDGVQRLDRWGDGQWRRSVFLLEAGHHTLRWRYVKDESISQGSDCAWIDDVRMPLALWDGLYGCAADSSVGLQPTPMSEPRLTLFPNPAVSRVNVCCEDALMVELTLTDLYGRRLVVCSLPQVGHYGFDTSPLTAGVYIVSCRLADGTTLHCRLAVNHK